ncbi:MAG: hypothetical protein HY080_12250 [Gammaproteobacteria bacterium]|nr:hypothetical protein [Gammaproteobacteria bacterium]
MKYSAASVLVATLLTGCGGGRDTTPAASSPAVAVTAAKSQAALIPATNKSHPGHYIVVSAKDTYAQINQFASNPNIRGVVKHYSWVELEPSIGNYDFSQIRADLSAVATQKKYFIVQIDLQPRADSKVVPDYLWQNQMVLTLPNGEQLLKIWDNYVVDRLNSLYAELAAHLDIEANFEGLIIQPPNIQLSDPLRAKYAYNNESYRDVVITLLSSARSSFVSSKVFWSIASMTDNKINTEIANGIVNSGVVMGGAELRVDDPRWQSVYQPFYNSMKDRAPLFGVIAVNDTGIKSPAKSTVWTSLLGYARERNVKYLLWDRGDAATLLDPNALAELLAVIDAAPKQ